MEFIVCQIENNTTIKPHIDLVMTFKSTRHSKTWIVIQSWKEMLVWSADVLHPLEQIDSSRIIKCKVNKLSSDSDMRRSLCY